MTYIYIYKPVGTRTVDKDTRGKSRYACGKQTQDTTYHHVM